MVVITIWIKRKTSEEQTTVHLSSHLSGQAKTPYIFTGVDTQKVKKSQGQKTKKNHQQQILNKQTSRKPTKSNPKTSALIPFDTIVKVKQECTRPAGEEGGGKIKR